MPKEIIIKFSEEDAEEIFELLRDLLDRVNNGSVDDGQDGSGGDQDAQSRPKRRAFAEAV